ncbi:DUF6706 family protein [Thermosediminibacter oceani]|uniref:Phage protein n=1 Tax=Thermosediminibacter oceani (strain ATCC BAA-1034 / DSM 16646 / JW/IW-1228P) TaxID=555079 RepID=D9S2Y7_THEOJ|nr:DUF6706 family protein [Thermosediminibacter oceani]ADL07764.1 conserved hypothetical protein [Thermosediminibacter oceani DSM 16646]
MTNLERLKIELKGINLSDDELICYLMEADLDFNSEYTAANKRKIYQAALSALNSIANDPSGMKNYKTDDITITQFADNIQNRIDQLERQIRQMAIDTTQNSDYFMLFAN